MDLRTWTNPSAGRPPTPPPPVISGDEGKDGWAKLKTPSKSDRDKDLTKPSTPSASSSSSSSTVNDDCNSKRERERERNSRDRLGRPRLFNKFPIDPKEMRFGRRGRESERNDRKIEIIMKQAAEQLSQGAITKAQYNKLIQEVLHMNEDEKLKAAQRKDSEMVWDKSVVLDERGESTRAKDSHPPMRNNGPRWTQPWKHGPWAHPPPFPQFNPDYRPIAPWQPARNFGPYRPQDYYHPHHPLEPTPRMRPGIMGTVGNSMMPPNGPVNAHLHVNNPHQTAELPAALASRLNSNSMIMSAHLTGQSGSTAAAAATTGNAVVASANPMARDQMPERHADPMLNGSNTMYSNQCLPPPDFQLVKEITKDTTKTIDIDNVTREIRYYNDTGVIFMDFNDPREIGFQKGISKVVINDTEVVHCTFGEPYKEFTYNGEVHR